MPAYRFEALDPAGKTVNGLVEADNPKAARAQLRIQQLVPLKVENVAAGAAGGGEGSCAGRCLAKHKRSMRRLRGSSKELNATFQPV